MGEAPGRKGRPKSRSLPPARRRYSRLIGKPHSGAAEGEELFGEEAAVGELSGQASPRCGVPDDARRRRSRLRRAILTPIRRASRSRGLRMEAPALPRAA